MAKRPAMDDASATPAALGLTSRQIDVLALVMRGQSNKAICRTLDLAEPTVKNHVSAILKALNVATRTEAVVRAGALGWHPASVGASPSSVANETTSMLLSLPERPSIAVLPFTNLSGDPAQDYFADGMVEDITMALGRLPWLFVIASTSAFVYKGRIGDPRQIGAELGVRYLLSGSLRKDADRVRIAVHLADASHGSANLDRAFRGRDSMISLRCKIEWRPR